MKIGLHGGNCCGIKHIYSLGSHPFTLAAARKPLKRTSFGQWWSSATNDMLHSGNNRNGKCDFFNQAAPKESYEERFRRFVAFLKEERPNGIIEVVITSSQTAWVPIFKDIGFKEGPKATNSNTGHPIAVYHLAY